MNNDVIPIMRSGKIAARDQRAILAPPLLAIIFLLSFSSLQAATSFDLNSGWSDTSNPNGVWAYREGNNPLPHVASWQRTLGGWSVAQPGWADCEDCTSRLPFWFKSNGSETFQVDYLAGDTVVHTTDAGNGVGNGIGNLTWTSPGNGTVSITGAVWNGRNIGRSNDWHILVNGALISGGSLVSGDGHTRANPFNFATGSGGASALQGIPVYANEVIELDLIATSSAGDFVGVNFTVNYTPQSPVGPPAIVTSLCSSSSPAPISGSTGALGLLDPANIDPLQGMVWPAGTVQVTIAMDTGQIAFLGANNLSLGSATLPGVNGAPAFRDGKLHFSAVHLPTGISAGFTTGTSGLSPAILLLSCQDVLLDAGSSLTVGPFSGNVLVPAAFQGANGSILGNLSPAGFGPRLGSLPAPGSLYPSIGGGGGKGGAGSAGKPGPMGGSGGPALVIAAAQRINVDGTVNASGLAAGPSATPAQGGAGGSVRLSAVLVEGLGAILTAGGADSDSVVRSPAGPVEIQPFLNDFFAGTASTVPIRGNAPVDPIPSNLPQISIVQVNTSSPFSQQSEFSNTGSLFLPDVILPAPNTVQIQADVSISTQQVLDGTFLTVAAVGTDGSSVSTNVSVSQAAAVAHLTLNSGTTYQIVVTPSAPFALARHFDAVSSAAPPGKADGSQPVLVADQRYPGLRGVANAKRNNFIVEHDVEHIVEQWMKAFAIGPDVAGNAVEGSMGTDAREYLGSLQATMTYTTP